MIKTILSLCFLCLLGMSSSQWVYSQTAQTLYADYRDRVYQIRLIELSSGTKAAIGSGFQVNADGLVATNYHVIAEAVYHPDKYRIEFIDADGRSGDLQLLDIDVIHDLALVKHADTRLRRYLELADKAVEQGEDLFSLGNPRDLGMTVVKGTFNGHLEHSFYDRILFSGSINPGMSGGPTLNGAGQVVGVNVATAGNQLSFLVPARELLALKARMGDDDIQAMTFKARIHQQLLDNQQQQLRGLITSQWPIVTVGGAGVASEVAHFIRCWGGSGEEEKAPYSLSYTRCFSEENIFLAADFSTGAINYEFYWLESENLNSWQFYTRYQQGFTGAVPVNDSSDLHVSNFRCHNDFVLIPEQEKQKRGHTWKAILCAREYKDYPGLYDLMYIAADVSEADRGLISHFTLSGVSRELGMEFTRKFMEHVQWK